MNYYYRDKSGKEIGPLTLDALARLRFGAVLDGDTPVRVADSPDWKPCREIIADAPQAAASTASVPVPAASVPGKPSGAWQHGWSLFALAGLCFLLPFLDLSCQGRKVTLTGQQMVTGTEVEQPPDPWTGRKEVKRVEPYPAAEAALGLAVAALLLAMPRRRTTSMLSGLAGAGGVISLLVLKSGIEREIATQAQGLVTLTIREGFWLACVLLGGGAAAQFKVFNDARTGRGTRGVEDWKIPKRYKVTLAILAIGGVLAYGGTALYRSLSERATLSFDTNLDGKGLAGDKGPEVLVDGQAFASGSRIKLGRHQISVQLQDAEPLKRHFWVLFGAKNLGTLPLETSKGSLTVTVNPSPASVVVRRAGETVRQGEAPLNVEKLPIGDYMLVVRRGEYEETQSVSVRRQQRAEAKIDLKLGTVDLSADPADADCELSGGGRRWQGKLPMRVNDVPVGSYSLLARRKGWELTGDVSVSRGNVTSNRIEFPYGSIDVTSEPSGLVVSTNGVEVGKTPAALRELRPGSYEVTASDGENDLAATISVGAKENVKKAFVFRYGAVQLASTPAGATVVRKGKEVGKTPLTLGRLPAGESPVELRFDGYASTNFTIVGVEGVTTNYNVKLMSVRYLESMKQAREAFDASQFSESQKFLVSALAAEPNDPVAVALQGEVSKAIVKAEEARKEAERKAQEAAQAEEKARQEAAKKQEEALRAEEAKAKAQALASMPWLDFKKVISDCTDTRQVQHPVQMVNVSYETYRDSDGKYKQRKVEGAPYTVMQTTTESAFNPAKFSAQYAGRTFRFNCPDKWSVSKVEKDGAIKFTGERSGSLGLSFHTICASPPANNGDAFKSAQKGQKITIKGVISKYTSGFVGPTLFLEEAEILDK